MKKLGKKLNFTEDTIEAYTCNCMCEPAACLKWKGSYGLTAKLGSDGQNGFDWP